MLVAILSCLAFAQQPVEPAAPKPRPVQVFVLAGQSSMQGQAVVDLDHEKYYNGGRGTLVKLMQDDEKAARFAHLRNADGTWVERGDVFMSYRRKDDDLRTGPLSIGFAAYSGKHHFGVELQFGHLVGDAIDAPVLLIKTAWGGKSLHVDFRPPSVGGTVGPYYEKMLAEVDAALANIAELVPDYDAKAGYELRGFVWFQGWNDMFDRKAEADYEQNLVHLIDDVRAAWKCPDLPVVVGETGNGGNMKVRGGQKRATERERFAGTVTFVPTEAFLRPKEQSPNTGHGHHWFGNAESYFLIGDAMGKAMCALLERD